MKSNWPTGWLDSRNGSTHSYPEILRPPKATTNPVRRKRRNELRRFIKRLEGFNKPQYFAYLTFCFSQELENENGYIQTPDSKEEVCEEVNSLQSQEETIKKESLAKQYRRRRKLQGGEEI